MTQNHLIAGNPNESKGFRAYWSTKPAGTAIVFVHGFNGEAVGTWSQFERYLPQSPRCIGSDLIFFQYDSLYRQCATSAAALHTLITQLCADRQGLIHQTLGFQGIGAQPLAYQKIVLVAHSTGAVVARKALLRMYRNNEAHAQQVSLVLFAPAHLGAHASQLMGLLSVIPYAGWVPSLLRYRYPPVTELCTGPLGELSQSLKDLRDETANALQNGATYLRARKVVFGEYDNIVVVGNYCQDAVFDRAVEKSHTDVCKPTSTYRDPIEVVLRLI